MSRDIPERTLEPLDLLVNLHSLVIDPMDSVLGQNSKKIKVVKINMKNIWIQGEFTCAIPFTPYPDDTKP